MNLYVQSCRWPNSAYFGIVDRQHCGDGERGVRGGRAFPGLVGIRVPDAETAEAAATAGVEDAMLRLARNAGFASVGYSVPVGAWTASVSVAQSSPAAGYVTAVSAVTVSNVTRKLSALFQKIRPLGRLI